MVWDTLVQFNDDFDNSNVDLISHPGNGTITEPAGTQLRIYCPENQHCNIYGYSNLNYVDDFPVAYKAAGPPLSNQKINGSWRFELKFDDFNYTYTSAVTGLFLWRGDLSYGYAYEFGYYPYEGKIIITRWLGQYSSGTRLATSGSCSAPNGTTTHIYRVYINPIDRSVWIPEHNTYLDANSIAFTYSVNSGTSFTWFHERSLDFKITWTGPYVRSWNQAAGRTYEGLFDYFSIQNYDWNSAVRYTPNNPSSLYESKDTNPRTNTNIIDESRFTPSGLPDYLNQIDRGYIIPATSAIKDIYEIFSEHIVLPGSKQHSICGGTPDKIGAEDGLQFPEVGGAFPYYGNDFPKPGFLFSSERQLMGAKDIADYGVVEADYQDGKLDGDGNEFLDASDLGDALLIDTTQGSFGDPTGLDHWGAARDGKFYANGVECTPGIFGTVADGFNHVSWRNTEEEPFAVIKNAGSMSITSDDVAHMTGTFSSWSGGPSFFSNLKWILEDDFDIQVDFDNLSTSSADHELALCAVYDYGPNNQVYIGRRDDHYTLMRETDGSWASIATGGSADTSGKLRLTRISSMIHGYYWNGSSWTEVGSGYTHPKGSDPIMVRVMINGTNAVTISVDVSNFTINSGTVNNYVGWYRESSGAHRGTRSDMPELLAVINTTTAINLIDVSNNKLWMRFVKDTNNLLQNYNAYGQIPRGMAWNNGLLFIAEGSSPSQSSEGGGILIYFTMDCARIHRQAVSAITGAFYTSSMIRSEGTLIYRNDGSSYGLDYDSWDVPNYRCYDVDFFANSNMLYRAIATTTGLAVFKWELNCFVYGSFAWNVAAQSYSTETDHFLQCFFDQSNGTLFYTSSTTLFSRDKTNGSTGWEDVIGGGSFTAEYSKALPGTRTYEWQYYALCYSTFIFIPADEGVYRVNWPSGSWELFYGVGGTHDILSQYDRVTAIQFINDGTNDLLIVGLEQFTGQQIVVIKLSDNTVYGKTAPSLEAKEPKVIAA